jgi:uncharacterized protein YdeI (YjbR/CyaY-like superfamily)
MTATQPRFFAAAEEFRAWLEEHHDRSGELWVGFYRKGSGRQSLTWPEAVDQALCFGWIDGVRRRIDETRYANRFTPRRPRSTWSAVNIERAKELIRLGLMRPAGLRAFEARGDDRSALYSYEQRHAARLGAQQERALRANAKAWAFFQAQPPWYRRAVVYWVTSAKKDETRSRRLSRLIEDCEAERRVPPLS